MKIQKNCFAVLWNEGNIHEVGDWVPMKWPFVLVKFYESMEISIEIGDRVPMKWPFAMKRRKYFMNSNEMGEIILVVAVNWVIAQMVARFSIIYKS